MFASKHFLHSLNEDIQVEWALSFHAYGRICWDGCDQLLRADFHLSSQGEKGRGLLEGKIHHKSHQKDPDSRTQQQFPSV